MYDDLLRTLQDGRLDTALVDLFEVLDIPLLRRLCHTFAMTEPLPAIVGDCLLGVLSEPTEQKVAADESTGASLPSIAMNNDYISSVLYKSKQSQLSPTILVTF